jgi:hypothetical protein
MDFSTSHVLAIRSACAVFRHMAIPVLLKDFANPRRGHYIVTPVRTRVGTRVGVWGYALVSLPRLRSLHLDVDVGLTNAA